MAPSELDRVESTMSSSSEEPLARDDAGVMTNDPRGCDGSKSSRKGSRGAIGSHLTHSTSPFESPRNRPEVGSSHVPHPCTCGPQSHWDRCTSLHTRGARGAQRWSSHRSTPLKGCASSRYINVSFGTAYRKRFLDACQGQRRAASTRCGAPRWPKALRLAPVPRAQAAAWLSDPQAIV